MSNVDTAGSSVADAISPVVTPLNKVEPLSLSFWHLHPPPSLSHTLSTATSRLIDITSLVT
jgi:hypothetical protein